MRIVLEQGTILAPLNVRVIGQDRTAGIHRVDNGEMDWRNTNSRGDNGLRRLVGRFYLFVSMGLPSW